MYIVYCWYVQDALYMYVCTWYIHRCTRMHMYIQGFTMYKQIRYMYILISCKSQQGFVEEMQNCMPSVDCLLQRPIQMRMGAVSVQKMLLCKSEFSAELMLAGVSRLIRPHLK